MCFFFRVVKCCPRLYVKHVQVADSEIGFTEQIDLSIYFISHSDGNGFIPLISETYNTALCKSYSGIDKLATYDRLPNGYLRVLFFFYSGIDFIRAPLYNYKFPYFLINSDGLYI